MNRGTIDLLYKGGERDILGNWHPISLLNVGYKILVKALQHRLVDLISLDQTTFILTRYILNNVLLLHETIAWAWQSKSRHDYPKAQL